MIRRPLALLGAALLCLAPLGSSALGQKVTEVPTSITFSNPESGVYTGSVTSKRAACRKGRRVTILEDRNDNGRSDGADRTLAKATSGQSGAYTATGSQAPKGARILVAVADKILGRASFCRSFIETAAARSG
ncbi:MAG TPA: hypothetical protein VH476_11915 [Solirubrobacterales bacterium]|jgi:hypothetical protein